MTTEPSSDCLFLTGAPDSGIQVYPVAGGTAAAQICARPGAGKPNEDAIAIIPCGPNRAVFAVADGFGGLPAGDQAARLAAESIVASVTEYAGAGDGLREAILNGFEAANKAITDLGVGAASTLAVAELDTGVVRPYHAGDSEIIIVGQRGKVKCQTLSHAPVAYGVEAGLIAPDEAMHHDERNIVSNMVGSSEMRIEVGPRVRLCPRDRLLLATDGVFDNLAFPEVVELIRRGPAAAQCRRLVNAGRRRMTEPAAGAPSKPDDIAIILFGLS